MPSSVSRTSKTSRITSAQPLESFLTEEEYEKDAEKPWHLWQPLTSKRRRSKKRSTNLSGEEVEHYGGDGPEAYGRCAV